MFHFGQKFLEQNIYFIHYNIVLGWLLIVAGLVCGAAKIAQVLCIFGKLPPSPPVLPLFLIVARRGFVNQSGGKLLGEDHSTLFKSRLVYFLPKMPTLHGQTTSVTINTLPQKYFVSESCLFDSQDYVVKSDVLFCWHSKTLWCKSSSWVWNSFDDMWN